jgi:RNA polymerase sigma-70 factor (ECF subfamily)
VTPERLDTLYRQLAPLVHARARRIIGMEADDIVQETFVKLMRANPDDSQLTAWLYTTATNLCLDRLRHLARRDPAWQTAVADHASRPRDAESLLASHEACRRLLAGLPRRTQAVAVLVCFDEMTQDEAADLLGVSRRTVAEDMRRVRELAARLASQEAA